MLNANRMANFIKNGLSDFSGEELDNFCLMIAAGSVNTLTGISFQTMDTGLTPGTGAGIGTGVTGVIPAVVTSNIMSFMTGYSGEKLAQIVQAIASGLVQELSFATLISQHTPVHTGTGIIVLGSIMPSGLLWGNNIYQQGQSFGYIGDELFNFSSAIGNGCAMSFTTATGQVAITGVGGTTPGSGSGIGTIS